MGSSISETHGLVLNGRYWSHEEDEAVCREIPRADKEGEKYPGFSFLLTISLAKCIRENRTADRGRRRERENGPTLMHYLERHIIGSISDNFMFLQAFSLIVL